MACSVVATTSWRRDRVSVRAAKLFSASYFRKCGSERVNAERQLR